MVKSIIIGCNGYLGRNLAWFLECMGDTVICFDLADDNVYNFSHYHQLDVSNFEQVSKADFEADYLFVFAGRTGTNLSLDAPTAFTTANELGLLNVLENIKHIERPPKIIFPSTRLVYKGNENDLLSEDSPVEPLTVYAVNKLACENFLFVYHRSFSLKYQVYRIGVPFGSFIDGSQSYGTISSFINQAKNKGKILLYGSGNLGRTFSSVFDICNKMFLNRKSADGIYNMSGQNLTLLDFAFLLSNKFHVPIENIEWPQSILNLESGSTLFDGSKLDNLTYFGQTVQMEEWIESGLNPFNLNRLDCSI